MKQDKPCPYQARFWYRSVPEVFQPKVEQKEPSPPFLAYSENEDVYHSASLEAAERAELEEQIDRAERWLDAHLGQAAPSEPWLRRHYALDVDRKTGRLKGWSRRADALESELRLCGCFALVSSEKMSAAEV